MNSRTGSEWVNPWAWERSLWRKKAMRERRSVGETLKSLYRTVKDNFRQKKITGTSMLAFPSEGLPERAEPSSAGYLLKTYLYLLIIDTLGRGGR